MLVYASKKIFHFITMISASPFFNKANLLIVDIRHYFFILYIPKTIEDKQATNKIQSMHETNSNIGLLHAAFRIFLYSSSVQLLYLLIIKISQVRITFSWRRCNRPFGNLNQSPPRHHIQSLYSSICVHTISLN